MSRVQQIRTFLNATENGRGDQFDMVNLGELEMLFVLTDRDQSEPNLSNGDGKHSIGSDTEPETNGLPARTPQLSTTPKTVKVSIQANPIPYCCECDKSFSNNHGLLIHNGRYHKNLVAKTEKLNDGNKLGAENIAGAAALNGKVSYCNKCDKSFSNNRGLRTHKGRCHKATRRDEQDDDSESESESEEESAESDDEGEVNLFPCNPCRKSFNSYHGLLIHNGRYHKDKRPEQVSKDNHQREDCKSNNQGGEVQDKEDGKLFSCSDCNKYFDTFRGFLMHAGRYHKEPPRPSRLRGGKRKLLRESDIDDVEDASMVHSCSECDKSFNSFHGVLIHRGRKHRASFSKTDEQIEIPKSVEENGSEPQETESIAITGAEQPDEITPLPAGGLKIMENDAPLFSCVDCDKSFNTYRGLLIHNGRAHKESATGTDLTTVKIEGKEGEKEENVTKPAENEIPEAADQTEDGANHFPPTENIKLLPLFCELCSSTFLHPSDLSDHLLLIHKDVKADECDTRGKSFSSHSNQNNHINGVHKNLRPHACSECKRTFKFRQALRYHVDVVHKHLSPRLRHRPNDGKPVIRSKPFRCDTCGQRFACLSHRQGHIDAVHKRLRQYPCPICGRRFLYSYDVPRHITIIHKKLKPYKCDLCEMAFPYFTQRKSHIDIVHKKLKQYICPECKEPFNCLSDLCKHLEEVHLGMYVSVPRKDLRVLLKDWVFIDVKFMERQLGRATLNKHVRFVHEHVNNYKCEDCGKAFPTASVHRLHVDIIHKGLKPFKCELCPKAFATRAKRRKHVNTKHQEEKPPIVNEGGCPSTPIPRPPEQQKDATTDGGLKPSRCSICDECCDKAADLKDHVSSVHAEQ
ncbi:hypothetical protein Aperf_G00000106774 [Anoplocephala perfoliata]